MSFGSNFMGVNPAEAIDALPYGEFGFVVELIEEHANRTIEVHLNSTFPAANAGSQVREWFKLGAEASSDKQREFHKRKFVAFMRSCGYADFAVDPSLQRTHKPLASLQHIGMLKGAKCCAKVGQVMSNKGYVNNEVMSYRFATKADLPKGPDANQPAPRQPKQRTDLSQSYGSPYAGYGGTPDCSGTGAEDDQGPPADYAGGYATTTPDDSTPF